MQYETATAQLVALRSGKISSVELVEASIARIEALDGKLNAIVVRDFERARDAAKAADAARAGGANLPLLGLPVTVKEAFNVAGLPTTWGIPGTSDIAVAEDAIVVARLKAAGAVVLGKSNVSTMLQDWQSANPVYGVTNNPWDVSHTPGGSSGGGTAALAAGFVSLEFGSDLAGSLRVPASFSGVFAHRGTHGLVPKTGFEPPGTPNLSVQAPIDQAVLGPMARSAADLQLALEVIAGPEEAGLKLDLPPVRHSRLRDFRVLVIDDIPLVPTAAVVRAAIGEIAAKLEAEGCTVSRNAKLLPDVTMLGKTFIELLMAFAGADMPDDAWRGIAAHAAGIAPDTADLNAAGQRAMAMSHRDWVHLDRIRFGLADQWRQLFGDWDVVLCPATPVTAIQHDHTPWDGRTIDVDGSQVPYGLLPMWSSLAIPTGQPVTTMPIAGDALPIGMQIIGGRFEDRTTIGFAGLIEQAFGGFVRPPGY
ncbi:amidase [Devosia sp.]|uniref:amidase n=1 Tax=Devosia sp. TaxID=1871048 RepID=UPI002FC72C77